MANRASVGPAGRPPAHGPLPTPPARHARLRGCATVRLAYTGGTAMRTAGESRRSPTRAGQRSERPWRRASRSARRPRGGPRPGSQAEPGAGFGAGVGALTRAVAPRGGAVGTPRASVLRRLSIARPATDEPRRSRKRPAVRSAGRALTGGDGEPGLGDQAGPGLPSVGRGRAPPPTGYSASMRPIAPCPNRRSAWIGRPNSSTSVASVTPSLLIPVRVPACTAPSRPCNRTRRFSSSA